MLNFLCKIFLIFSNAYACVTWSIRYHDCHYHALHGIYSMYSVYIYIYNYIHIYTSSAYTHIVCIYIYTQDHMNRIIISYLPIPVQMAIPHQSGIRACMLAGSVGGNGKTCRRRVGWWDISSSQWTAVGSVCTHFQIIIFINIHQKMRLQHCLARNTQLKSCQINLIPYCHGIQEHLASMNVNMTKTWGWLNKYIAYTCHCMCGWVL